MKKSLINGLTVLLLAAGGASCKEAQAKTQGVGDVFRPFIVKNCGTGDRYCQVCAYGGKPTIMVVADIDDTSIEADLVKIQSIVEKNEGKALTAFALFGSISDGKFTPVKDDEAAAKKLKEKAERLKLTFPITVVPAEYTESEKKGYTPFTDSYQVGASRRLMLADQKNKVLFADTISDAESNNQFKRLEEAVAKL